MSTPKDFRNRTSTQHRPTWDDRRMPWPREYFTVNVGAGSTLADTREPITRGKRVEPKPVKP